MGSVSAWTRSFAFWLRRTSIWPRWWSKTPLPSRAIRWCWRATARKRSDIAETYAFDVLVTDLAMPRVTGWELIPRLRARRADLPVVVMTGYLPPGGGQTLFADKRGPLALLHKPFDIGQLFAALGHVVPERTPPGTSTPDAAEPLSRVPVSSPGRPAPARRAAPCSGRRSGARARR